MLNSTITVMSNRWLNEGVKGHWHWNKIGLDSERHTIDTHPPIPGISYAWACQCLKLPTHELSEGEFGAIPDFKKPIQYHREW